MLVKSITDASWGQTVQTCQVDEVQLRTVIQDDFGMDSPQTSPLTKIDDAKRRLRRGTRTGSESGIRMGAGRMTKSEPDGTKPGAGARLKVAHTWGVGQRRSQGSLRSLKGHGGRAQHTNLSRLSSECGQEEETSCSGTSVGMSSGNTGVSGKILTTIGNIG